MFSCTRYYAYQPRLLHVRDCSAPRAVLRTSCSDFARCNEISLPKRLMEIYGLSVWTE